MSEEKKKPQGLIINAQYLRDLSFESPNAPMSLGQARSKQPNIKVDVNVSNRNLEGNLHEVVLKISAAAKAEEEQTLFIVEAEYGAVVTMGEGIPENSHAMVLGVEVPRLLFPFIRKVLADATQEGGFPPLMLGPIDFTQFLRKEQKEVLN